MFALLFTANLARVAILVVVGQVLGARLLAEMMHVPLGVLGFAGACAVSALLLRGLPAPGDAPAPADGLNEKAAQSPGLLMPTLAGTLAVLILAGSLTPTGFTPRSHLPLPRPGHSPLNSLQLRSRCGQANWTGCCATGLRR